MHGTSNIDWIDNTVVTVASSPLKHGPYQSSKRYSRVKKALTDVPKPHLIKKNWKSDMGKLVSLKAT